MKKLGVWVFLFGSALYIWASGIFQNGAHWAASNEPVSDFLWARSHIDEPFKNWFGGWSIVGEAHPGPLYLWWIAIGMKIGGILNISEVAGGQLFMLLGSAILIGTGSIAASKFLKNQNAGWIYAFLWCAISFRVDKAADHALALQSWVVVLLLPILAMALIGVSMKERGSIMWALVVTGLIVETRMEFFVPGLFLMVFLVIWAYLKKESFILKTLVAFFLVFPLFVRLLMEGPYIVLRYIKGAYEQYQADLGSTNSLAGLGEAARLNPYIVVGVLIISSVVGLVMWLRNKENLGEGLIILTISVGILLYAFVIGGHGEAHAHMLGGLVPFYGTYWYSSWYSRRPRNNVAARFATGLCGIIVAVAGSLSLPAQEIIIMNDPTIKETALEVKRNIQGPVVLSRGGELLTQENMWLSIDDVAALQLSLVGLGVDSCIYGERKDNDGGQIIPNTYVCETTSGRTQIIARPTGTALPENEKIISGGLGEVWTVRGGRK